MGLLAGAMVWDGRKEGSTLTFSGRLGGQYNISHDAVDALIDFRLAILRS